MKKLVVFYSYTGHTKMIAENIQRKFNCDILEITPDIQKIDKNINEYDEIIIGTPVWWYTIAPVIRTFLTQNDLSNKTIKPFATNAGWLGHTFQEIQKLCPDSRVDKGMNIVFTEDHHVSQLVTSPDEIDEWIEKL